MIKISVIVPIYNKEKYIKKLLESLLNQSLKKIEIILIDDGSNDKSEEICKKFEKQDVRIKYVKIENQGVSIARNQGLDIAKGEYCIFIDADDFINKRMLLEMYELSQKNDASCIVCGMIEICNKQEKQVKFNIPINEDSYKISELIKMNSILFHSVGNKLFKREILISKKIKFKEKSHNFEDLNFVLKYFIFSDKNYILNKDYYYYYRNLESITFSTIENISLKNSLKKSKIVLDTFLDMKLFLEKNKTVLNIDEFFRYKMKEFQVVNFGFKSLQNIYIKNKRIKTLNLLKYSLIYKKIVKKKYNKKIATSLKIRLVCFIFFRRILIYIYNILKR